MIITNKEELITFDKCMLFLHEIGIKTIFRDIGSESFLPGFLIEKGVINIDRNKMQNPGDILHEAGHLAVIGAIDRISLTEDLIITRKNREFEEIMAIAWSYMACLYLDIDPIYVFHTKGYRSGSDYITESCSDGSYLGLQMLQGIGLTACEKSLPHSTTPPYPYMIKWLRD